MCFKHLDDQMLQVFVRSYYLNQLKVQLDNVQNVNLVILLEALKLSYYSHRELQAYNQDDATMDDLSEDVFYFHIEGEPDFILWICTK